MKVIIGAGTTDYPGWIATNLEDLDVLSSDSMHAYFSNEKAQAFLAEHVWEHFTEAEGICAAKLCYEYLQPGGYIRIAVPDGNLQDATFLKLVGVGGPGPQDHPAYTHKILYTYKQLIAVFERAGFSVNLLEYCDENGDFHFSYWNPDDGMIGRSLRFDSRNSHEKIGMASIIIDAYKPLIIKAR